MKTLTIIFLLFELLIIKKDKTNIQPYLINEDLKEEFKIEQSNLINNIYYLDTLLNLTLLRYKKITQEDLYKCFAIFCANLKFSTKEKKWLSANFVFSQAIIETNFGKAGKNHKTNMFALYETDAGTKKKFKNYIESTEEYFYIIHRRYKKCKTEKELLFNFTNCHNLRYASSQSYEKLLQNIYNKNQNILKNYKKIINQEILTHLINYVVQNNKKKDFLQIIFLNNTLHKKFVQ